MAETRQPGDAIRRRIALTNRSIRKLSMKELRAAVTGRNAAFALGAAIVVALIWIFNFRGTEDSRTVALRETGAAPPSAIVNELTKPVDDTTKPAPKAPVPGSPVDPKEAKDAALRRSDTERRFIDNPNYRESVEVDISTRSVAVTSGFSGSRIVVFGAVHNSLQASAEQGLYDVVVVLEGAETPLTARRKSNVAGIWINTQSVVFEGVPSYYTISSTRPIEQISIPRLFDEHEIGFRHVRILPSRSSPNLSEAELQGFREAIVRLKAKEGLYQKKETGVKFIGRSLFRTSIDLPANVPIGTVVARTYLFRDAELIAKNTAEVELERQGLEALMYTFAFDYPLLYGIFAVAVAVAAGLVASAAFNRGAH
jgi:uncharacterized protein (TIGR02186 family)